MADKQDAALLVQLAQWATSLGIEEAQRTLMSDDFDAESADALDPAVQKVLEFGETIATLTKNNLLDTALVLDWLWIEGMWERVKPAALKLRQRHGVDALFENFEALASTQR